MRPKLPPIYRPTECLNLKKLETESRMLLLPGAICGFFFFILLLRGIPVMDRFPTSSDRERAPRITLAFVTLYPVSEHPPSPDDEKIPNAFIAGKRNPAPETPAPGPEQPERELFATPPDSVSSSRLVLLNRVFPASESRHDFPNLADSAAVGIPDSLSISIFEKKFHELSKRYGRYGEKKKRDMFKDINLGDRGLLRVGPGLGVVVLDLFPLEEKPVEDDRCVYRQDLFGLSVGRGIAVGIGPGFIGGNALGLINTGRHLVKTIQWNRVDARREKGLRKAREEGFSVVSASELRFLILMWRDERLDPARLLLRDREFISQGGPLGARSYQNFLFDMEKKGLVISLRKGGRMFYRAKCTREEILQALTFRFSAPGDSSECAVILKSIDLITRCTDLSSGKVVIPDVSE